MLWDEENCLRGINDNGRLHLYTYDHTGERALKSSAESSMAVINGASVASITHTDDYTAYISPYFVVNKGKFTKHFFEGSSRIVSKLGEGTFVHKNTGITAGGVDYLALSAKMQEARDKYIKGLKVPPGPPTQQGIYASPEWTGEPYPSIDWQEISQNQPPPNGWPRPPKFNAPGDVPGPPVQFGNPITNANVKAGYGFVPNGVEEKNLYFYHPDHLGSSSYITDKEGRIIQHTEYMAFGEVLFDEHSVSPKQPYLFNGKELDYETGLYYYGARYYDPKVSLWLNVDPLVEKTGTPYAYTYNNPIRYIDPTGMEAEKVDDVIITGNKSKEVFKQLQSSTSLKLKMDDNGRVTASGKAKTDVDRKLLEATEDSNVIVQINATSSNFTELGKWYIGGAYGGSTIGADGKTYTIQTINPEMTGKIDEFYGMKKGVSVMHEVIESYIGGVETPGIGAPTFDNRTLEFKAYENAHDKTEQIDPRHIPPIISQDPNTGHLYINKPHSVIPKLNVELLINDLSKKK